MKNTVYFIIIILIFTTPIIYMYYIQSTTLQNGSDGNDLEDNQKSMNYNYTYKIINSFPHDSNAFTQGLVYENETLYEGTGLNGRSSLRKVNLESGKVILIRNLSSKYFGEGVTVFGDRIIQLTWKSKIGFVYDKDTFELIQTFNYTTEGWGLTHDGTRLIMSDGTDSIYFLDPETYDVIDGIKVFNETGPIERLNELEYIEGEIYANVWQTDYIIKISPQTGEVTGRIYLSGLLNEDEINSGAGVLNGIAYDENNDRLFVTGKLWPKLFEIELVKKDVN